jgi:hypothetical protein
MNPTLSESGLATALPMLRLKSLNCHESTERKYIGTGNMGVPKDIH